MPTNGKFQRLNPARHGSLTSSDQGRSDDAQPGLNVEMRVAVVHEWLDTWGGAEKVLAEILSLFPKADLFVVVDFLSSDKRAFLANRRVETSFIQRLPMARKRFRWYLPLMPIAMEQLDLSEYDLVISSSHAVSKGVLTRGHQLHVSYVHSPMRYAWDLQEEYLGQNPTMRGVKSALARLLMHYIRIWDVRASAGVDCFIANSLCVARRITKVYRRTATVIYPPVDVHKFVLPEAKDSFYLTVCRLVSYKRVDLLLRAFAQMPGRELVVLGSGPELATLRDSAPPNVSVRGSVSDDMLVEYLGRAKAFVYAGEEDFGIAMVEAQASGTPVLAFARGGAAEIVRNRETGLLFDRQTPEAIVSTIEEFENNCRFDKLRLRRNAMRFSTAKFREAFSNTVRDAIDGRYSEGLQPTYPVESIADETPVTTSIALD